jgi:hypothetical protein
MLKDKRITPTAKVVMSVFCSYCSKAGITHVSQTKVAEDLQIDQSRVSRAMATLQKYGYIEQLGKPFVGIKGKTLRVIYDPEITATDAIAIAGTSDEDDLQPGHTFSDEEQRVWAMTEKETWTEKELRDNKEQLARLLASALKTAEDKPRMYNPVPGDTLAVKKIKQEIRARMRQIKNEGMSQTHTNTKEIRLYVNSTSNDSYDDKGCNKGIQPPKRFDYEDIVVLFNNQLFNGVKTERDLQTCALFAERGIDRDVIEQHISAWPTETVTQIGRRILGTEYK